jgi:hypothetical protein
MAKEGGSWVCVDCPGGTSAALLVAEHASPLSGGGGGPGKQSLAPGRKSDPPPGRKFDPPGKHILAPGQAYVAPGEHFLCPMQLQQCGESLPSVSSSIEDAINGAAVNIYEREHIVHEAHQQRTVTTSTVKQDCRWCRDEA